MMRVGLIHGPWFFFYIDTVRVSPVGFSHVRLRLDGSTEVAPHWISLGWEADVYEEWRDLEHLRDS